MNSLQHSLFRFFFLFCLLFSAWTSAQSFRDSVDVLNYTIRLTVADPLVPGIQSNTTLNLVALYNNQGIRLDLLNLTVDSVLENKQFLSFDHDGKTLFIHRPVKSHDTLSVSVYYHGIPAQDKRWGGFYFTGGEAFNYGVGMDAQPPVFGRCWFPCIDNFTDRAFYHFAITVPEKYTAVCNGINTKIELQQNHTHTWHWNLGESIPTYLASVAIGPYDSIHYSLNFSNRNIPVSIYDRQENISNARNSFINLPRWMDVFTDRFGPYRWDRIGFVIVPFRGGAMEHAANIAISRVTVLGDLSRETLYAHELSHSWFGDLVTCSSEADMWLNEGWASYAESIMLEGVYGKDRFISSILNNQLDVLMHTHVSDGGYFSVYNLPHELTYGSTIYDKGALVVHNLRQYLGDSLFFSSVKKYLETYAFKNCSVPTFQKFIEKNTGTGLSGFFNFWVYGSGFNDIQTEIIKTEKKESGYTSWIKIHQALLATNVPQKDVITGVGLYGRNKLKKIQKIAFSGSDTVVSVHTDFQPLVLETDPEYRVLNACVHETFQISQGSDTISTNCLFTCMFSGQKEAGLLSTELHFTTPPNSTWPIGARPDTNHYWKISTIDFQPKKVYALFGLDPTAAIEDLSLFYRESVSAPWKNIPARIVRTSGSLVFLYIEKLLPGYYATGSMGQH